MKKISTFIVILLFVSNLFAQKDTVVNPKTGWSFGGVPVVAFDSDIGFKYGGLVNFYDYGDGKNYPKYDHSIYVEWSRTTKGSGINNIMYDSEKLLPNLRLTVDINYLTEKALNFYGFNGYESDYNPDYEDDSKLFIYKSRMFYRHERKLMRITTDVQGKILGKKLRWLGGFGFYGNKIATVDVNKLNEDLDDNKKLPLNVSLYDDYVNAGIIPQDQKNGGNVTMLKAGLVFDTRDNEPNPMKGIWTEALLLTTPSFLGNDYSYTEFVITHRQYFTLAPKVLNLAVRLGYEAKLGGTIPFYMLPFYYNSTQTKDAFGGSKTSRGILRNRITGDGVAFGNVELRWKFLRTVIKRQNFYIALSTFLDGCTVTQNYDFPDPLNYAKKKSDEGLHASYGAGLHFVLNENFIVAFDYGMAAKKQDGTSGLYINLNFLY